MEETKAWHESSETWRVLRAYFSGSIETRSLVPDFFADSAAVRTDHHLYHLSFLHRLSLQILAHPPLATY